MVARQMIFSLLLGVALLLPSAAFALPATGVLTPDEANELVSAQKNLSILDVRTPEEFAEGHAANAVNIPLPELANRLGEVPSAPLLILCRAGVRASNAYAIIAKSGRKVDSIWFLKGATDYSSGTPRFH